MKHFEKGMVLAAGLGTRLLPITEKEPKPLVPVLNVANVLFSIAVLKRAGVRSILLNLHHLPECIENFLGDGEKWGVELQYSRETLLLGTGGGVKRAQEFFSGAPFILVNCDFISNVDLSAHVAEHVQRKSIATMILWQNEVMQSYYSKVGIDAEGHLCSLPRHGDKPPTQTGIFTGIHLLENDVFKHLKEVPSGINEILYPALMQQAPDRVFGSFMQNAYWYDTGELHHFCKTSIEMLSAISSGDPFMRTMLKEFVNYEEHQPGVWAPSDEPLPKDVRFHPPVILGRGCKFGSAAVVGPYTVLGDESTVGKGAGVSWFLGLRKCDLPEERVTSQLLRFRDFSLVMKREATSS